MKFRVTMITLALGLLMAGCGQKADENKTPEQIKQEVTQMDTAQIQKQIDVYTNAIKAKSAELKVETDKLAKIPLTEMLGDEAKSLQGKIAEMTKSLDKLKANLEAYAEGLKTKQ
ncbi:hypothetical protein SDC9_147226 [bioreactor metagenome]|uniref:Lipoprotein n=1 Tax=bioreactor metagenome TaxID=1076179 RepID=A0A645EFG7_9ZZZZ